MHAFISRIIKLVFSICIKHKQAISMLEKDDNASKNFVSYQNEKFILKEKNIDEDDRNLINKSLNTKSRAKNSMLRCTSQNMIFAGKLSSF